MTKWKSWYAAIRNNNISLHDRMFRLFSLASLIALIVVDAVCIMVGEGLAVIAVLGISWLCIVLITFFAIHTGRVDIAIQMAATLLIWLILPVGFFFGGGLNGGSQIWFVFCFVYISLMMTGRVRNVFFACALLVTGACYLIADQNPGLISGHADALAYLDAFSSVVLLSAVTCVMILFQKNAFEQENRLANEQKKEIMELNEMQNHFFSSMSHEIRTPINTIIGLNEMTLREQGISDEVAENSLNIQGASRILLSLINDILDMSKIESGKMTIVNAPYDVGVMLSEIVNMIWSRTKEKDLAFHVDIDPSLPARLNGDEVRIKQVLINILNNAVKYTERGSVTLTVSCKRKDDGHVTVTYAVADTGEGIKKENIPYLFNAFRRVDEKRNRYIEGTGLGLSIVKQLVELMGGEVTVDSIYTKGSTFVVVLDQGIEDEGAIGELHLERRRLMSRRNTHVKTFEAPKARVLIVDDNEVNLLVAQKLLRETGMKIDTAISGEDCLKETMRYTYDLIFMDHLMPKMDGIACLHALRSQAGGLNTQTPVIALTANAGSDAIAMYEREGFDDCLLKPVSGELLEQAVIKFLPPGLVIQIAETDEETVEENPVRKIRRKRPVRITTESVCDLPEELLLKKHVSVMPFTIHTEGGDFLDGVEIDGDAALSYIELMGKRAYATEPEVPEYIAFFARQLERSQQVIHIAAGKGTSGAFFKATAASQTFGNVMVINSAQLSGGLGFLVLRASQMAEQGVPAKEIVGRIEALKTQIRTSFLLDTTKYQKMNGRIPKRANIVCEAFMLHPFVAMTQNGMQMRRLYPGKLRTAWKKYIREAFRDAADVDKSLLFITYSGLTAKDIHEIEELIAKWIQFDRVIKQNVSPSSSTMFGPGTFGLAYVAGQMM